MNTNLYLCKKKVEKMRRLILFVGFILFCKGYGISQSSTNQPDKSKPAIIKDIEKDNGAPSNIHLYQDSKIIDLLNAYTNRIDLTVPYTGPGYRVQVFSSNNYKTAKSDAARIEQRLRNGFPEHQVYIIYVSPFWKVRVGDFRTSQDAQKLRSEIIQIYPDIRKDCYTVRESRVKIN